MCVDRQLLLLRILTPPNLLVVSAGTAHPPGNHLGASALPGILGLMAVGVLCYLFVWYRRKR